MSGKAPETPPPEYGEVGEGFRTLDHTADIGVEVQGADQGALFRNAARALTSLLTDPGVLHPLVSLPVAIEAGDTGELLVHWLNTLLYLFETRGFLTCGAVFEEMSPARLRATLQGETYEEGRHPVHRVPKAATYHRLQVMEDEGRWVARVYFDL